MTGERLIALLKESGTGENKLKFARALISENPAANAGDVIACLERNQVNETTIGKARTIAASEPEAAPPPPAGEGRRSRQKE